MKKRWIVAALLLAAPFSLQAQTVVTATVVDSSNIPYSFARVSAQLVPTGTAPTVNGQQISAVAFSQLDANGVLSFSLADNALIVPGGTQWAITVCETPGVPPPLGTGSQCFTITATITGAAQSLTTAMNAAAPALTRLTPTPSGFANQQLSNLVAPTAINVALRGTDGTVAAPAYAFTSQAGSGMYWSGTQLCFARIGVTDFCGNGAPGITSAGTLCATTTTRCIGPTTLPTSLDPGVRVTGGAVTFGLPVVAGNPSTAGWGAPEAGNAFYNSTANLSRYWNGSILVTPAPIVATAALAAQTMNLGPTTLATAPADSLYVVDASLNCDSTSAAATVLITIAYTDISNTAQTVASSVATCTALGASSITSLSTPIQVRSGSTISYTTTIANTPTYDLRIGVTKLQ